GRDGRFAAAMAGYLMWLAPRLDAMHIDAPTRVTSFREQALGYGIHRRTPEAITQLALGWTTWLDFAVDVAALTQSEGDALFGRMWRALEATATRQGDHQIGEEPARRFLDLLAS